MSNPQVAQDETPTRAQRLLLDFLSDQDAICPLCGYNLRALTRPICPECGQELRLTVGSASLQLGWLFAAIAPGFFSGIAAVFVFALICVHLVLLGSTWTIIATVDTFGWLSGISAIVLARKRARFLMLSRSTQRWAALGIWLIHVFALGGFIVLARYLS